MGGFCLLPSNIPEKWGKLPQVDICWFYCAVALNELLKLTEEVMPNCIFNNKSRILILSVIGSKIFPYTMSYSWLFIEHN